MITLTSRRIGAAVVAVATLAGALALSAGSAQAQCKYGGPNCVNPRPGVKVPRPSNIRIPESNWVDPDCKYYGNCRR